MSFKGEFINKVMGGVLMASSMVFFSAALGIHGAPEAVFPGVLFGAGGFWLIARREKRAELGPESQQRLDRLAEGLVATQTEIAAMQDTLQRLGEEHDFMRQLATPSGRAPGLPARSTAAAADSGGAATQAPAQPVSPAG